MFHETDDDAQSAAIMQFKECKSNPEPCEDPSGHSWGKIHGCAVETADGYKMRELDKPLTGD